MGYRQLQATKVQHEVSWHFADVLQDYRQDYRNDRHAAGPNASRDVPMLGLMMKSRLLLSSILTHAARTFPDVELVSRTPYRSAHRTNYACRMKRSSQLANARTTLVVSARHPR